MITQQKAVFNELKHGDRVMLPSGHTFVVRASQKGKKQVLYAVYDKDGRIELLEYLKGIHLWKIN